jgi:Zn-dependent alcohol dehydrogenase
VIDDWWFVNEYAAAVAYAAKEPLSFEDVLVAPPHAGEVRVKIINSSICQSDLYYLLGKVGSSPVHLIIKRGTL